ncbi:MAG: glycosyl transferase family 1 [Flavobacteriales bacterium]|nr:MAG: glycosyl transferase family 1 [Flavobacteriales bacterium]
MKIAIIGTRGIPNHYGGFEQFAEYLALGLVAKNHQVWVYNSHLHPFKENNWKGVNLIHCKDLEHKIGTPGQFIYDFNCIIDSRKRNFDIILQLGYTSSSVWGWLLPKKSVVITNMDGLEWKRTKFSKKVQRFLKYAEKLAVKKSNHLVADSIGIQQHIKERFNKEASYIAYGADVFNSPNPKILESYNIHELKYYILIARMEPENNIETILDGFIKSNVESPFLVIGEAENKFGSYLKEKFKNNKNIQFLGGIFDMEVLNNLRHYAKLYFHGHSVGGTNPSLLEAMASNALIVAHNNIFNESILGEDAMYFTNSEDIANIFSKQETRNRAKFIDNNIQKIKTLYSWGKIIDDYEKLFIKLA